MRTFRRNLEGERFGKLTVRAWAGFGGNQRSYWTCDCECGETSVVMGASLTKKDKPTRSCGCLQQRFSPIADGQSAFNQILRSYRCNAVARGLEFELSREQFEEITRRNCVYCGSAPANTTKYNSCGQYKYNGIDRVDNTIGYIYSNCVPCCKTCNFFKGNRSAEDFIAHCLKVAEFSTSESNGYYSETVDFEEVK